MRTQIGSRRGITTRWIAQAGLLTVALGTPWPASSVRAQGSERIVTDRPDFVESPLTVGRSVFQFETSVAHERDETAGLETRGWITPTLLRYGIFDLWELRLETVGYISVDAEVVSTGQSASVSGMGDIALGAKWHTTDNDGAMPDQAWIFKVILDTGSTELGQEGTRPAVSWIGGWGLTDALGIAVQAGLEYDRDDSGDRYFKPLFGVVFSQVWTDRVATFVELANPRIAGDVRGGDLFLLDLGVTYGITPNWQWDFAAYVGLNQTTPDLTLTTGLSARF